MENNELAQFRSQLEELINMTVRVEQSKQRLAKIKERTEQLNRRADYWEQQSREIFGDDEAR